MPHISGRRDHPSGLSFLFACTLIGMSARFVPCQTSSTPPPVTPPIIAAPRGQTPAYEVATIKPAGANENASPLRVFIQGAFGIPVNSIGWVIGPDWINSARYVIHGKPSETVQRALQTMTAEERRKQVQLMNQALLADRFKLRAHFETREMPVYQLIVAKDGPKLEESPLSTPGQIAVGASMLRGKAISMHNLVDGLESVPEIGGRVVVDKTGLSGAYDFVLKWTPFEATAPPSDLSASAPSPGAEGVSLFKAIEEQLGLKLVWTKGPGQVLVIDQIERPTEN